MNISGLLENLKVDINSLSMGERLLGGLATALLSMLVVFVVLVLISCIIKVINPKSKEVEVKATQTEIVDKADLHEEIDDTELIAAITAAIVSSSNKNIVVRRIRRTNNIYSNWEKTANVEV